MNDIKSFLMVGVGGQGIVLASNVLCDAAMNAGYDVKKSEIHGMAQRGGSVVSHVRYGAKVYSPVIPKNAAQYVLSFEHMEYLRYLGLISDDCTLFLNTRHIFPPGVALGTEEYPNSIVEREKSRFNTVYEFDADNTASELGNAKTMGIVLLGKLSTVLDIDSEAWREAIRSNVPSKALDINFRAFEAGVEHPVLQGAGK